MNYPIILARNLTKNPQNRHFCALLPFGTLIFGHFEHKIEVFVRFLPLGPLFSGISSKRLRDYVLTPIYEASTFAEKHLKMEELIPVQSASRYRKTIDDYKLRLKDNPDLNLSEFCKEVHTNYRRVLSWTRRHGISISALKRKASGGTAWGLSDTEPGNAFIQFVPSSRLTSASLLGISITFPDGVNLTLQESSVESVISLLTIYQSRHGGAKSCSD